jgi:hypothetical protein
MLVSDPPRPAGVRGVATSQMTDVELARTWAAHYGYTGRAGGWIYDPSGMPVLQGWDLFAQLLIKFGYITVGVGINWRTLVAGQSREVTNPTFSSWWRTADGKADLAAARARRLACN